MKNILDYLPEEAEIGVGLAIKKDEVRGVIALTQEQINTIKKIINMNYIMISRKLLLI